MSNFRKALARAGSILLVAMCVIGMLIPAHAEDLGETVDIVFECSEKIFPMSNSCVDFSSYLHAVSYDYNIIPQINWDEVEWFSSNSNVISNEGNFSKSVFDFVNEGNATITASYKGITSNMDVKVIEAENKFHMNNISMYLYIGDSETVKYELGRNNVITSKLIECGEDCIRLDGDKVTAVASGHARIKYTDIFNNEEYVYVKVTQKPESISFDENQYVFTMRPKDETITSLGYSLYRSVNARLKPEDVNYSVKTSLLKGDCIIYDGGEFDNSFRMLHSGTAIIKAESTNGLSVTTRVIIKQGTYAIDFNNLDNTIQIKPRESIDLKEEVKKRLISGTDSNDFTDEMNELKFKKTDSSGNYTIDDNGIFQSSKAGKYYVGFTLANGNSYSFEIKSLEAVRSIRFGREDYYFPLNTNESMNSYLRYVPEYMQNVTDTSDIQWSSSNSKVADFKNGDSYLIGKSEGTTEITAEYKGLTATATVHFINADTQFYPEGKEWSNYIDIKLKQGEKAQLKYVIGENNYVISKDNSNEDCIKFDQGSDSVEALTEGSTIVTYIDRFHKEIKYQITVSDEAKKFNFIRDINAIIRPDSTVDQYYVNYDSKPFSSNPKIKWEVEGDQSIIEEISDDYEFRFRPLKAGTVTLRGTTENGLTDTCKITVSEGNYITGFNKYEDRYSITEGDTLNLKQLTLQNALPEDEDVSDDVITYTVTEGDDVVNVSKDGVLTTKKEGKATIRVTTFGDQWMDFYVSVTEGVKAISFEKEYYSIPWKLDEWSSKIYSSLTLKTDPSYAISGINADDIKVTASEGFEIQNISQYSSNITLYGYIYYPGDYTVNAEYNGLKCSATIHVYEEKEQTELTLDKKMDIKNGFQTAIPYSFGKEEKTDCKLSIVNGNSISLVSDTASKGVFVVKALNKGKTTVRVTSVDNSNLYKDIVIHVKDNVKDDYSFTLFYNDEEVKADSNGTYVMKYGKEYRYEFLSKTKPSTNYALYTELVDTGAITSTGGAGCGLFEDKKLFGESGGSKAGKTGSYTVELWPGASLKFRIVSDFERAESGSVKVQDNTGDSVQIDEAKLESLQSQLTEKLPDKITKDSLNTTVEAISENSDDLIGINETAKVQLSTETTVSMSEDGKKLIYDITPSITVKACEGSSGRTIGEKEADVDKSVEMTLPTGNFINPEKPVYITHVKEDGTKYVYEGAYDKDNKTISFTDPHGYSTFEITQDKSSVPSDVIKPDVKDPDATVKPGNRKNEDMKTDKKKAVDTSDHSNIGMYAGITGVAAIIAVMMFFFRRRHAE